MDLGTRKSVLSVLVYVFHGDEILLIHRNKRDATSDDHAGKWNGLGGKCEPGESMVDAAARELREESGLDLASQRFSFLGFIQFPLFKPHKNEDWNVGVFAVDASSAERAQALASPDEGTIHWKKISDIPSLSFWPGDESFLPHVLKRESFHGVVRYENFQYLSADIRLARPGLSENK